MRGTILQPTYLPWLGYFEMIARSDVFVCFDHVRFSPKSWQQRNRIKGPSGPVMLTVPVLSDGTRDVSIRDKRIDCGQPWARKHLKSIESCYSKATHFAGLVEALRAAYASPPAAVADMNLVFIRFFMERLGIGTAVVRSSDLALSEAPDSDKTGRIIDLCRRAGIDELLDGKAAESFVDVEKCRAAGISVRFQNYAHPEYPQLFGGFVPYLSALDLLMNCGGRSLEVILSGNGFGEGGSM